MSNAIETESIFCKVIGRRSLKYQSGSEASVPSLVTSHSMTNHSPFASKPVHGTAPDWPALHQGLIRGQVRGRPTGHV